MRVDLRVSIQWGVTLVAVCALWGASFSSVKAQSCVAFGDSIGYGICSVGGGCRQGCTYYRRDGSVGNSFLYDNGGLSFAPFRDAVRGALKNPEVKVIDFELGTNYVKGPSTCATCGVDKPAAFYRTLAGEAEDAGKQLILPVYGNRLSALTDAEARRLAAEKPETVRLVDYSKIPNCLSNDRVHPTADCYKTMAQLRDEALKDSLNGVPPKPPTPLDDTQPDPAKEKDKDGCGKDTFAFGCHAYLIGGGDGANPKVLAARGVQSVTIDPSHVSAATVADLNKSGPIPIFYTNAFWQKSFGGQRPSQCLSDGVATQYGECMIDPRSADFYPHFQRQLAKVKSLSGSYIEIDNMDAYVRKGYTADIVRLIQLAAQKQIHVLSKNETSPAILKLPNVVGAIVEAGNKGSGAYRKGFEAVGKKCAGVVMINAGENRSNDPYVSYTTGNHPKYQHGSCAGAEYTKFCGCTPNSAGPRVAGTPVAVGDVPIPPPSSMTPPTSNIFSNPLVGTQPFGGLGGGPAAGSGGGLSPASAQFAPQAFRGCADNPTCTNPALAKNEIQPITDDPTKKKTIAKEKDATKEELDELFGDTETGDEDAKKEDSVEVGPRGTLSCIPRAVSRGESVTVAWRCPKDSKASVRSSDARASVETTGARFGTRRVRIVSTTQFSLACGDAAAVTCSVALVTRAAQEDAMAPLPKAATPFMPLTGEEKAAPRACFLGFCL